MNMQQLGTVKTTSTMKNNVIRVTYVNTDIVIADPVSITLDCGGWISNTTVRRMNQASNQFDLGYTAKIKNGQIVVSFNGQTFTFTDKVTFNR